MPFLFSLNLSRVLYSRDQIRNLVIAFCNRYLRMFLVIFILTSGFTARMAQASEKQPAVTEQKLVYLDLQTFDPNLNVRAPSLLTRELFRQAFLIAARDELGYRTRDVSLGDTLPAKEAKGVSVFNVHVIMDRKRRLEVQVFQKTNGTKKLIEKRKLKLTNLTPVTKVVAFTEELSRTWFKDILVQAGYVAQSLKESTTDVPVGRAKFVMPKNLNYRQQFTQLMDTHDKMINQGESPERLALLAQSYVLYGTLTEQYWSLIPLATKARALLYAERLQQKCPQTAYALSYRAFVRTLVGLDQMALADIQKMSDSQVERSSQPEWLPVIEAYCLHQAGPISEIKLSPENDLLQRYLKLLQATYFGTTQEKNSAVDAVLTLLPDSIRAFYTKPRTIGDRQSRQMIYQANVSLINYTKSYFEPKDPHQLIPKNIGSSLQSLMKGRDKIVAELHSMGANRSHEAEPSFSLLASSVKELTFVQACDFMSRNRVMRGVNSDKSLNIFLSSLTDHPFKPFLKSFSWDNGVVSKSFSELRFVPEQYLTPSIYPMFIRDRTLNLQDEPLETILYDYPRNVSHVISELAYAVDYAVPESEKSKWVSHLRAVSPHSPYTIMQEIALNWEQTKERIPQLLKKYADSFLLIHAIAHQYRIRFDYPRSELMYKRMFRKNPTYETSYPLIQLARIQDKHDLELKLHLEAMKLPGSTMQKARQHTDLAKYYNRRGDYRAALPHAQIAAQSYSSWGLTIEAECHELLGDLSSAFEFRKRDAIRYQNQFGFHAWCRSRGVNPPRDILKSLKPVLDYYSKVPLPDNRYLVADQLIYNQLANAAFYQYLENEPKSAMEVLRYASEEYDFVAETFPAVLAALIADELGLADVRDECLSKAIEIEFRSRGKRYYAPQLRQILLLKQILTGDSTPQLSPEVIDWYLQEHPNQQARNNYLYFIGKALLQKKQDKLGIHYLKLAAASPKQRLSTVTLAAFTLLKLKVKKDPFDANVFGQDTDRMLELLDAAHAYQYHKKYELELINYNQAEQLFPESSLVFLRRAKLHAQQKKRDLAEHDFSKAVKLTPEVPDLWLSRGEFYESTGNDKAAIDNYQQTLKRDPESYYAHQKLAILLAASLDDKVRDGMQALKHAEQATHLLPEMNATNLSVVAVAYAELKQFDKAKQYNQNAIEATSNYRIKSVLQKRQKLYEAMKPFRLKKRS
ncbi:tetratricopeptide repeat protein [uncultured Gimesia sp.]|uniref:tetratricopeptide repeat protein n=1 Tax=uncultured Gimesia sp. TaxID=1678688 RepID=UPI0026197AE1|nr:tetratricopeptide repeat protein [uncultured Gimesia sp.]